MTCARVRETVPAMAVLDRGSRESRERCGTRVRCATITISKAAGFDN
jgi:hypothetical protein